MKIRIALATFAGVATMATLGAAAIAPSAGATTTPSPVTHVVPAPPGPGDLSARLSMPVVKGKNVSFVLTLTNVSHHAVTVSGFPDLKLLNIFRHPLPTRTVLVTSPFFIHKVVLFPGHSATAKISFVTFGRFFPGHHFLAAKAAFLQVTLPSAAKPWPHHGFMPQVRSTLWIPGGPVRVVQNTLYETALTGMPFVHR